MSPFALLRAGLLVLAHALLASCAVLSSPEAHKHEPMNILFLLADDVRWDSLGAAGNDVIVTPRLDQLSAEGVRFTQARVTTSVCMTSRASLLTGQYMSRHRVERFSKPLSPEQFAQTYVAVLRRAGYWAGFVGKYGVGAPRESDFDFLRAYEGRHWLTVDDQHVHVTEQNTADALDFLAQRPADKPFVLSVSYFAPHAEDSNPLQYLPQPWSAALYEGRRIPVPPTMTVEHLRTLPPFLQSDANEGRVRFGSRFDTPEHYQTSMTNYYRLITEVDRSVGRLIEALKEQGLYERTLIIYTSDNGYFHGERMLAGKWYPYEQSLRVPLIVRDPRLEAARRGTTVDALVLNIDVAPTILAAAGLRAPEVMQGRDAAPLYLANRPPPWRNEFFYEHPKITSKHRIPKSLAVVSRTLKYTCWPNWNHEQLFDLRTDPDEAVNLAQDPAHANVLAKRRKRLEALQRAAE